MRWEIFKAEDGTCSTERTEQHARMYASERDTGQECVQHTTLRRSIVHYDMTRLRGSARSEGWAVPCFENKVKFVMQIALIKYSKLIACDWLARSAESEEFLLVSKELLSALFAFTLSRACSLRSSG